MAAEPKGSKEGRCQDMRVEGSQDVSAIVEADITANKNVTKKCQ